MMNKYYARQVPWGAGKWALTQRDAHGDRTLASGMSERTARRAARLFNEDEEAHLIYLKMQARLPDEHTPET